MSINARTTKKGLVEFIKESAPKLTGKKFKSLADSVAYTMKKFAEDANQVLKDDLLLLAQDIQNAIGPVPAPVENSLKVVANPPAQTTNTGGKSGKNTGNAGKNNPPAPPANPPAPTGEQAPPKAPSKPKLVTQKPVVNEEKQRILAENFPKEFTAEGIGKLRVLTDEVKTLKDVYDLVTAGKSIFFAMYWTKRHLAQFQYDIYGVNAKADMTKLAKNGFPNDLDLAQLMFVSEEHKVAYVVSAYSEVIYSILPTNLEFTDGMRFTNGIEYNIYEIIE